MKARRPRRAPSRSWLEEWHRAPWGEGSGRTEGPAAARRAATETRHLSVVLLRLSSCHHIFRAKALASPVVQAALLYLSSDRTVLLEFGEVFHHLVCVHAKTGGGHLGAIPAGRLRHTTAAISVGRA